MTTDFNLDILRETFLSHERIGNEQLQFAESEDKTSDFLFYLRDRLNRKFPPKNINIIIYGTTRDGKSYSAFAIGDYIRRYILKKYGENKTVHKHRDESEFLDCVAKSGFQDIHIIDEQDEQTLQDGSWAEKSHMKDVDNICAAKALTVVRLKPQQIFSTNANIILKTHGNNYQSKENRLLIKIREMEQERWIGHVIIPLKHILCDDRNEDVISSCNLCPKFEPKQGHKKCEHEMAIYERRKMENIDDVTSGKLSHRAEIIKDLGEQFADLNEYARKKTKIERVLFVRLNSNNDKLLEKPTNRVLTNSELETIVAWADGIIRQRKEDEEGLI